MRTFQLKLRIKDCKEIFNPDWDEGVIAIEEIGYHTDDLTKIAISLTTQKAKLIANFIEIEIEEVNEGKE